MHSSLIGGCGIYCGACDHYVSNQQDGRHLLDKGDLLSQKLISHPCDGCKSENIETICIYCRNCAIRLCTINKNIKTCAQCELFPCEEIHKFKDNFLEHKKEAYESLGNCKELGINKWFEQRVQRWKCPNCGNPYSFYETECYQCREPLNGLFPDRR